MSNLVLGRENTGKFIIIVSPYNMEVGVLHFILYFWLLLVEFCVSLIQFSTTIAPFQYQAFLSLLPKLFFDWIYYLHHFHTPFLSVLLYIARREQHVQILQLNIRLEKWGLPLRHLTGSIWRNHSRSFFQQPKHNWWIVLFSRFLSTLVPSSILKTKESSWSTNKAGYTMKHTIPGDVVHHECRCKQSHHFQITND